MWIILGALLVIVPRWTRTHPDIARLSELRKDVELLHSRAHELEMSNARMIDHIIALGHSSNARKTRAIHTWDLLGPNEILVRFDEDE